MDNKSLKTQSGAEKKGKAKKVKKLLFLPAPKRKVGEVLGTKKVEQSKAGLTPSGASLPHTRDTALKQGGENLKLKKGMGVKGKKSGAVGHGSGIVAGRSVAAEKHTPPRRYVEPPLSRGDYTPLRAAPEGPLSPTLRSGQARGDFISPRRDVNAEQASVRRPGQVPEVVAERIFLKRLKELSSLGVRRRREIKKARLVMILKIFI